MPEIAIPTTFANDKFFLGLSALFGLLFLVRDWRLFGFYQWLLAFDSDFRVCVYWGTQFCRYNKT
ncbi:hypothetical protein ACQ10G_16010, partial [Enterococcus faecalis]